MNIILHDIKVAFRNLMKYKLRNAEMIAVPNSSGSSEDVVFHFGNYSEIKKESIMATAYLQLSANKKSIE